MCISCRGKAYIIQSWRYIWDKIVKNKQGQSQELEYHLSDWIKNKRNGNPIDPQHKMIKSICFTSLKINIHFPSFFYIGNPIHKPFSQRYHALPSWFFIFL